ncbi:MAG: hypothetical protein R3A51_00335 [Nannocystaceae bacterium]|nr:hypothetical protein [Myxococcales bacterium]
MRTPMLFSCSLLLALSTSLSVVGCAGSGPRACTEIGCGSSVSIELLKRDGVWGPGAYTVTVVADGETTTCSVTMPLSCDAPPPCGENSSVVIGLSGCALPVEQQSLSGVEVIGGAPKRIEVQIALDGQGLSEATFTPEYRTSRPNGPECEPECTQTVEQLVMKL